MSRILSAAALIAIVPVVLLAQSSGFEVASIKRTPPTATYYLDGAFLPGGRFEALNATLVDVMHSAYPDFSRPGTILGGPSWVRSTKFDIDARAGHQVEKSTAVLMLQQLLRERFELRVVREKRSIDVYILTFARDDRSLGERLKPASPECGRAIELPVNGRINRGQPCDLSIGMPKGRLGVRGAIRIRNLAGSLQRSVQRPVVDQLGLDGVYEIDLEYDPPWLTSVPSSDAPELSLFTALKEQLGLRLVPSRQMGDVLVISSVQFPSPN